jgi:hypothetical protein
MDKTLILGMVSSVVAIIAAVIAVWGQLRVKRVEAQLALQKAKADRRAETEQTASRFREPLGRAAYELQSRIFNIIKGGFLTTYLEGGDGRTRSYAINHTLFVTVSHHTSRISPFASHNLAIAACTRRSNEVQQ